MCGLVGCVGKIFMKEENAFKFLLQLDVTRGPHSTGIMSVTRDKSVGVFKDIGTAWDIMAWNDFDKLMRRTHSVLMGHNRFATKGKVTEQNAHPFTHGDITGAHNGTLNTQWALKDYKMFDVDSDNIMYNISEEGVHETLKKLNGAFALTWYDKGQHTMNLVRNDDRPLVYCYSEDMLTLWWASESWMLYVALSKNGIKHTEIKVLEPKQMMTVEVPTVPGSELKGLVVDVEEMEFYKPPSYHGKYDHETNKWNYDTRPTGGGTEQKNTQALPAGAAGTQTPATTGTGVIVHPKVSSLAERRNLKDKLAGYSNKWLTFSVAHHNASGSQEYFVCDIEDQINPPELRIFTKKNSALGALLFNSPKLFKGEVCGHSMAGNGANGYLRVDHRSIQEIDEEIVEQRQDEGMTVQQFADSLQGDIFSVFGGKMVSLETYLDLTNTGCCECGDYVSFKDHRDLLWVSGREFFCPKCRNSKLAAQYELSYKQ